MASISKFQEPQLISPLCLHLLRSQVSLSMLPQFLTVQMAFLPWLLSVQSNTGLPGPAWLSPALIQTATVCFCKALSPSLEWIASAFSHRNRYEITRASSLCTTLIDCLTHCLLFLYWNSLIFISFIFLRIRSCAHLFVLYPPPFSYSIVPIILSSSCIFFK